MEDNVGRENETIYRNVRFADRWGEQEQVREKWQHSSPTTLSRNVGEVMEDQLETRTGL